METLTCQNFQSKTCESMIIYIYSKCSTCQHAVRFLDIKNVEYTAKEIVQTPPTLSELKRMLDYQNGNLRKLFNTSGNLYREMKLTEKLQEFSLSQSLELLTQHGMLIKRPFVLGADFGLLGFKEIEWAKDINIRHRL